jgi:hypothetical protein
MSTLAVPGVRGHSTARICSTAMAMRWISSSGLGSAGRRSPAVSSREHHARLWPGSRRWRTCQDLWAVNVRRSHAFPRRGVFEGAAWLLRGDLYRAGQNAKPSTAPDTAVAIGFMSRGRRVVSRACQGLDHRIAGKDEQHAASARIVPPRLNRPITRAIPAVTAGVVRPHAIGMIMCLQRNTAASGVASRDLSLSRADRAVAPKFSKPRIHAHC